MKSGVYLTSFLAFVLIGPSSFLKNKPVYEFESPKEDIIEYVHCEDIYTECWNELPQALFWKKIMTLSKDSVVLNVARTRLVLDVFSRENWESQSNEAKDSYRMNKRIELGLDSNERIFATTGKSDFYKFDIVIDDLKKGIDIFKENKVDPWYAQTIMLIECPGQLKKSTAGAYGAFQLMPGVARSHGLIVNRKIDERKDFEKCAKAASEVIEDICIPEAKKILKKYNIDSEEKALWFKLLTLHIYHAGAMNVSAVVDKINPIEGSQELIKEMWKTKAASFGNSSQNYSQLALAANLILSEKVIKQKEVSSKDSE